MASQRIPQALKTLPDPSFLLTRAAARSRNTRASLLHHPTKGPLASSARFGSGGPHFNQPSGWLFGEKPLKPGQKRVREDWELIWYIGFWGTTVVGIIMQVYKPDRSIQTWARHEAEQKMEKPTYEKS
ncbi:hypothetical protein PCANC_03043 [Puccinia coronata f. sp. avenae]|uniref:NADH dehydrogenase [ubiquinone] 1 beta subcomplex subunit 11, mitochondrial n=1 Tax=Puccinia coronata f. sp. avenae TaxID=200324 RepID=A0A2N5UXM6_9BASI|nr:hypothetical protein PCANC_28495 [Puccinia coronata f. sp. avenae]PLW42505.1 hypothetical protein PCASD_04610 [Puccinia coronata f. sp. avenae]PLW51977.1 hypothetical protein PCANC_08446 [Puccinia coronata f. sp. avenae]PLW55945.1 hypothetical protein PCANC_03043 [Puccinia coronata f. sp. avenae]